MYFVYALTDPGTDAIFYIGITYNTDERLKQHISCQDANIRKHTQIQKIKEEDLMPSIKVLETVKDKEIAMEREKYWIYYYLEQGIQLTNLQLYSASKHKKHEANKDDDQNYMSAEKRIKTHFYTTAEVRMALSLTDNQLQQLINLGRIQKIFLPGNKLPFYSRREIDKLVASGIAQEQTSSNHSTRNPISNTQLDKLCTAKEAVERLGGISSSSFRRLVTEGKIRKVTPPNKKNGLYLKEDIDSLV